MTDKKLAKNNRSNNNDNKNQNQNNSSSSSNNNNDDDEDQPIKFTPRHFSFSFSSNSLSSSWSNNKKLLSSHQSSDVKDVYYYPYSASSSQSSTPSHKQQSIMLSQHQEIKQTINLGEIFWYIPHPIIPVNGDALFVPTLNGVEISETLFAQQPFLYRGESIAIKLPIGSSSIVLEYLHGPMTGYDFLNYIHHFYIINKRIIEQDFWNNNLLFSRIEIDGECLRLVTSSLLD